MKVDLNSLKNKLLASSLFKDSFWSLTGNIFGKGFSLVAGIVVARLLGSTAYGEYGIIKNTLLTIAMFSSFGLGITATKFIAETKEKNPSDLYAFLFVCNLVALFVSASISVLVVVFAPQIALYLEAPRLSTAIRWTAIAIVFNALNTTQIGILGGFKAYKATAHNNVWAGLVTFIITIPLTFWRGFNGAIVALVISLGFNCLINRISINKRTPKEKAFVTKAQVKEIVSFSFPVALQESLYALTNWLVSFVIIKSAGYAELGLCTAATQWMAVMSFIPGALRNVALSYLSTSKDNKDDSRSILNRLLAVNFVSTMFPCICVWLLSSVICGMYGPDYIGLRRVLNVMVFTAVVTSLTNIITQDLISRNQNWFLFSSRLIRDLGIVSLSYWVMNQYSLGAFAYACISLVFQVLYLFLISSRRKRVEV